MHVCSKQLNYGSFDPVLNDKRQFPSLFSMVPKENVQYAGIIHLLKHFGWNWIGLIASEDESGEDFVQNLQPKLSQNDICVAWVLLIPLVADQYLQKVDYIQFGKHVKNTLFEKKASVFLASGTINSMVALKIKLRSFLSSSTKPKYNRVWIVTCQWDFTFNEERTLNFPAEAFNGSLYFSIHTNKVPGFQEFLQNKNTSLWSYFYMKLFWASIFQCSLRPRWKIKSCTWKEDLGRVPSTIFEMSMSGESYNIYNAVYSAALALQAMHSKRANSAFLRNKEGANLWHFHPWQV